MYILGISAFYHDSAAAILKNGEIIAAAQEERFSRIKHDNSFPLQAVNYCLKEAAISINDIAALVYYEKPLLKFERLISSYYAYAPKGFMSFLKAMPVWLNKKLFLKRVIRKNLHSIQSYDEKKLLLLFPEHHLSHAASAYYPSAFQEAAILTMDGVGEWATTTICKGKGNTIELLKQINFPHSVGLLYSAFTYYLGFKVNSGEYKLMGLAPYGNSEDGQTNNFISIIRKALVTINDDGSIFLNTRFFNYTVGLRMVKDTAFEKLFGFPKRNDTDPLRQHHCNLAYAIQHVTEEIVIKLATHAKQITGSNFLCLSGGVALNCVANGKLLKEGLYSDIFIQPAAGDAGGALGAALAAHYIYFEKERTIDITNDYMKGTFLGPSFSNTDIEEMAKKNKAPFHFYNNNNSLYQVIADLLNTGKVVGWFQGRMEFGPRALGNRSIIADPRNEEMQKRINLKIKFREGFRPFAPAVLAEDVSEYFSPSSPSPYMLFVQQIKESLRFELPAGYKSKDIFNKLYLKKSLLPAITHIDYSARVQTVHKETNKKFYDLISAFKDITGYGVLVNTSFNVRGEPVVCTPTDAYRCFMRSGLDCLAIDNYIFFKHEQPAEFNFDINNEYFEKD